MAVSCFTGLAAAESALGISAAQDLVPLGTKGYARRIVRPQHEGMQRPGHLVRAVVVGGGSAACGHCAGATSSNFCTRWPVLTSVV